MLVHFTITFGTPKSFAISVARILVSTSSPMEIITVSQSAIPASFKAISSVASATIACVTKELILLTTSSLWSIASTGNSLAANSFATAEPNVPNPITPNCFFAIFSPFVTIFIL